MLGCIVVGGDNGFSSAELYDPKTGTWTNTGSLTDARWQHTATLLHNGMVLVAAGADSDGFLNSAELYDPRTGTWADTGSLNNARTQHTTTLLHNGVALVTGGSGASSAELFGH